MTRALRVTIIGSLAHLHVNVKISIITWKVLLAVFTVKTVKVLCKQVHCKVMIEREHLNTVWKLCFFCWLKHTNTSSITCFLLIWSVISAFETHLKLQVQYLHCNSTSSMKTSSWKAEPPSLSLSSERAWGNCSKQCPFLWYIT